VIGALDREQIRKMSLTQPDQQQKRRAAAPPERLAPPRAAPGGAITPRALALAFALVPFNTWWLTEIEYVRYSDNATTSALFFNAIALLLFLIALNAIFARLRPRWVLAPGELATIYLVAAVASNLAGHDQLQILFTTITYVVRRSGTEPGWNQRLMPHVPRHLVVMDRQAVEDLYLGNSTLYRPDHLRAWAEPLAWWFLFVMLVVWVMLCLASLLRRQWDAERLSYPIAEVPVQVITQADTLFRRPLLWGGSALGGFFQILNLLHTLWPIVPGVPIGVQYYQADDYPWRAAGSIPISFFPFAYGLTFLLPLQLAFSCWFFFLLSRVELVIAAIYGHTDWNGFPYVRQQGVGAAICFALLVLWMGRGHLRHAWRTAVGLERGRDEGEPLPYRVAVFGFLLGTAGLMAFAVQAGMQPLTAVYYFVLLLLIVLVVARLRAEVGLPTFEFYQVGADEVLQRVGGTRAWSTGDLTTMSLFFWLTRTHRQFPMQTQVDGLRLARRCGTPLRGTAVLILVASAIGTVAAFWAFLHVMYPVGYESAHFQGPAIWAFGLDPWRKLDNAFQSPLPPDRGAVAAYFVGAGVILFLATMRAQFVEWPFHPAGYLVAGSFGLMRLWLPLFFSWMVKALLLRYGGLRAYRAALPFFIGLVLGEFSAGFFRTILDLLFGLRLPPASGIGGL
jgi:Family of unknown function (DUF6785)/Domain of unknown function (DUF6784)